MSKVSCLIMAMLVLFQTGAGAEAARAAAGAYPWRLPLQDQRGRAFDLADFAGRTTLLSFVFTHCPQACPVQTAQLARARSLLPARMRERAAFVSVSIDPERDSPERLAAFAEGLLAGTGAWSFGRTDDTAALDALTGRLGLKVDRRDGGSIDHKMTVFLLDAGGRIVQRYIGRLDEARLAREIAVADSLFGPPETLPAPAIADKHPLRKGE
jgi:cytochrome oxidase Cu insertion factor (SCO1/SenC/PrrC family)